MINFTTTTEVLANGNFLFGLIDYGIFSAMLLMSAFIGIYFGFFGKKQNTVTEYALGGKAMNVLPVTISIICSKITGTSIISVPTDVYMYGASYSLIAVSILLVGLTTHFVFLPVYHNLQVTSMYEYLKLRFGKSVQTTASTMFIFGYVFYTPIIMYVAAIAFSRVSGANVFLVTSISYVICIFYTSIGGMKGVIWTDALQCVIMMGSIFAILILGILRAGSFGEIFRIAREGGRAEIFDLDIDPTNRTSFWTVIIGRYFTGITMLAVNPVSIQKFMSLSSLPDITKTLIFVTISLSLLTLLTAFLGLLLYTEYRDCDPLTAGKIDRPDQLLIHYVMTIAGQIPGFPGIFVAGVFCASLSSVSGILNNTACTIYKDLIEPCMPKDITQKRASDIMKMIVVIMGVLYTALVFVIDRLGSIMALSSSLGSLITGSELGVFSLGMLVPSANTKGVLWGIWCGIIATSTIIFGAQYHKASGALQMAVLPISTSSCNFTIANTTRVHQEGYEAPYIFRISFYYYTLIGFLITVCVGYVASKLTGGSDQKVDRDLLSPVVHWMLPKKDYRYNTVAQTSSVAQEGSVHPKR